MYWKESGGDYEPAPLGAHIARCVGVIDLGTRQSLYGPKRDVMIRWELPLEQNSKGEVFTVAAFFTQSLSEKANLRKALVSWRGREFTPEELKGFHAKKLLGVPGMVNVIEKPSADGTRVKHVVSTVSPVPKGMTVPQQVNEGVYVSLEPGEYDSKAFAALSEKIQDMVKESAEWRALQNGVHPEDGTMNHFDGVSDDDIPF